MVKKAKEYDVIVVGTGPTGATVAAKMAQDRKSVLILEKGRWHPQWMLGKQLPSLFLFDKLGMLATKEGMPVARCITVGGSSVLCCGAASPPYPGLFEKVGMDLTEDLKEAHTYMRIEDDFPEPLVGKNQMRMLEVANNMGYKFKKFPRFVDRIRCESKDCSCMKGCPHDAKWTGRVPVKEAMVYGADLVTGANVTKAIVQQGEAVGVETKAGDKYYGKTVVISAGGLSSPLILRKSGITGAGDKFGVDALWFTYGFSKEFTTVHELDMGIYDDTYVPSDGFVLSPVMHTWGMYLASATVVGGWSYLPKFRKFPQAVSIMTKIKDDLGGTLYDNGTFSKPLTNNDWTKLKKGEAHATKILKALGCKSNDIFSCKPFGAHPSGTVRIGDHIDTNFETKIKNLFACDTSSYPESMGLPCVWTCAALGVRMAKVLKKRFGTRS